jgi:adenosine kinase
MMPRPTKVLVCGSLAMDHLLRHRGSFKTYQETYGADALNASLPISEYRTCYGGCGGNIAYGLGVLGVPTVLLSHAGRDFLTDYQSHLLAHHIDCQFVAVDPNAAFSARCTILSDDYGNQITGFYPGSADASRRASAQAVCEQTNADFALLGPEAPALMMKQARELASADIPFIFDPGQWVSEFTEEALEEMLSFKPMIFANEHEVEVIRAKLSMTLGELSARVPLLACTKGADGVDLFINGARHAIQAVKADVIADTTGSGDAFRAGFIFGLSQGRDAVEAARLGALVAARSIAHQDPQGWSINSDELM